MGERVSVLALLHHGEHDYPRLMAPLLASLESSGRFRIESVAGPDMPPLDGHSVVLAASDRPLQPGEKEALTAFVRGGGGLILMHGTLASWSPGGELVELADWAPGGVTPLTELNLRPAPAQPLTDRLPEEWRLVDEIFLSEAPPADATVIVQARWRYTDQVIAYTREVGAGRFVYVGLGHGKQTHADATFGLLMHRLALHAAGVTPAPAMGVGLVGYGAIGRDHASSIQAIPGLRLAGICDLSSTRREAASRDWAVPIHSRVGDLLGDPGVGLVVVGTPPSAHTEPVLDALEAGKHVVCEKPFAIRVADADRMLDAASAARALLTVYQSRRWDPDFQATRDVVDSGAVGELFYMESFIGRHAHPCDFWHSHEPISGGTIYDWGSHYFDWILQLFRERVVAIAAQDHKRVWHDVTNADQVRVDLTFANGAQAEFLQSDIAAAMKPKWYALGTRGAVVADWQPGDVPADRPARVKVMRPGMAGSHEEVLSLPRHDPHAFYRNLAGHLAWGEPLAVTADQARRTVAVMEAATDSIARGGARVSVDI